LKRVPKSEEFRYQLAGTINRFLEKQLKKKALIAKNFVKMPLVMKAARGHRFNIKEWTLGAK